ncbi:hypothetical protein IE077_004032 [Cardiosporidium cionae]|uniref:Uncharacterized protein n=1 Tax=Cardiosporidium cionae TaxID=476202 RepID=A0ABQ7JEI7_9APIC|nr:hypothetical protein IE077_004032 [Cardiosporidium cionae]|eukprot:KAF8822299.1 hypothetical protein IE077_004032 [Cardiosporidium cionae]
MSIPDFLKNSAPGRSLPVKEDTAINTPITPTGGFPLPESLRSHSFASWLPDVFSNNPYFTAGFGLIGVGAALGILRQSLLSSMLAARRFCLTSLEIPSKDYSYSKVMQWLIAR